MRTLIIIVIVAAVLGAGYFFMNISSYQPSTGTKIQELPEQNIDDLMAVKTAEEQKDTLAPVPQNMGNARDVALQAFEKYTEYQNNLPKQAQDTMVQLIRLMAKNKLPIYFVNVNPPGFETQPRYFEPLHINPFNISHLRLTQGRVMCNSVTDSSGDNIVNRYKVGKDEKGRPAYSCVDNTCPPQEYFDVMVGDILANQFLCDPKLPVLSGDKIYLGGPGDDIIKNTQGNVIVDGGSGNDSITLGAGRKIMLLSPGWGQDVLNIDCKDSQVDKTKLPGFPLPWKFDFTNFLIFGNGIQPEDLKFDGLQIEHITTGDKVTFNDYCFNIVFAEDFQASGIPDKID